MYQNIQFNIFPNHDNIVKSPKVGFITLFAPGFPNHSLWFANTIVYNMPNRSITGLHYLQYIN